MKIFIPEGNAVLCERISDKIRDDSGFLYQNTDSLPLYRVISLGPKCADSNIVSGDTVICDSTGNMFKTGDKTYHMFLYNNIIGKIKQGK